MISEINSITLPAIPTNPSPVSNSHRQKTLYEKIQRAFWTGLGVWTTYNLIDKGLSYLLLVETLPHGTGPYGFLGINFSGANPAFGGGAIGSSAGIASQLYIETSKNYFHVFKGTTFAENCIVSLNRQFGINSGIPSIVPSMACQAIGTLLPRMHAFLSGKARLNP